MKTLPLESYVNKPVAIYGLSKETEKFLIEHNKFNIIGLLDSFQKKGVMFGKPIISLETCLENDVCLIIVIARPGSCRAIANKIRDFCNVNNIKLCDIYGNDLLAEKEPLYSLNSFEIITKSDLLKICDNYELITFDLFDTIIMRKVLYSSDIFFRVEQKLHEKGIFIDDFVSKRISAEKSLSLSKSPVLEEIYAKILKQENISVSLAKELSDLEWQLDYDTIIPRYDMIDVVETLITNKKKICIITDTYYRFNQIEFILKKIGIDNNIDVFVSCEAKTGKTQKLFSYVREKYNYLPQLHIGDDIVADIKYAENAGIKSFHIYSASDLFEQCGSFGLASYLNDYNNRLKTGLIISKLFNSPFKKENNFANISISNNISFGYCLLATIITEFMLWFYNQIQEKKLSNVWFGARDGYLIKKLYSYLASDDNSVYFLISRISSIRAGMYSKKDIEYVNEMNFSGTYKEKMYVRFGIDSDNDLKNDYEKILEKSKVSRNNYLKYINSLNPDNNDIAFFDFVAKGTSQIFCQKLVDNHFTGLYFLKFPNSHEIDSKLDVISFIDVNKWKESTLYNDYYIIETILTSPYPSVIDFDNNGNPIYSDECRTENDINCVMEIQQGIIDFFNDFMKLYDKQKYEVDFIFGEKILNLVHKFQINNQILNMQVEDDFFNRKTNVSDLI